MTTDPGLAQPIPPPPPPPPPAAGPSPGGYPIDYDVDFVSERSRLSVFFRIILVIPWLILSVIYELIGGVLLFIAWFALLFVGHYPQRLYDWNSGILRFYARMAGFAYLATDVFPPIGWADDAGKAQRVAIGPRAESQSRLKVFFRVILALPLFVISYGLNYLLMGAVFATWLTVVFRGYQPRGLHDAIVFSLKWHVRVGGYIGLLTDVYPPVGDGAPALTP